MLLGHLNFHFLFFLYNHYSHLATIYFIGSSKYRTNAHLDSQKLRLDHLFDLFCLFCHSNTNSCCTYHPNVHLEYPIVHLDNLDVHFDNSNVYMYDWITQLYIWTTQIYIWTTQTYIRSFKMYIWIIQLCI